jgi:DNA-binding response OmpR family regulator
MRLLIVEDEPDLASALQVGLRREGYAVDAVHDGAAAGERLAATPYDLVCLDLGLPDVDGRELCRRIRSGELGVPGEPPPRVLMLTARTSLADRVGGLDDGADDYLAKPYSFEELGARIRALLRRDTVNPGAIIRVGTLELDASRYEARRHGRSLDLTPKEFALLRYLMLHPGQVITPERLLEHVWDEHADPFSNTVRVTISNLRRKLAAATPTAPGPGGAGGGGDREPAPGPEPAPDQPIQTVTGVGYRLLEQG